MTKKKKRLNPLIVWCRFICITIPPLLKPLYHPYVGAKPSKSQQNVDGSGHGPHSTEETRRALDEKLVIDHQHAFPTQAEREKVGTNFEKGPTKCSQPHCGCRSWRRLQLKSLKKVNVVHRSVVDPLLMNA